MGASILITFAIVVLDLVALGLGIVAEQRRAPGTYESPSNATEQWCHYSSDISTGLAAGAAAFLLISQVVLAAATRCLCFGTSLKPGAARAFASVFCVSSWISFVAAEACFIAGAVQNAKHIRYISSTFAHEISCEAIRKDTFVAGVVLTVVTCILGVSYYLCYSKAQEAFGKVRFDRVEDGVSMSSYP
ncbi:hypothetical protein GOP47_0019391 [Adiantum capillus-veneris]|uniref:Fiber protein Fb34 n=1 Tax=Adiantum capillus-veneris TaxID=13818 RepID=A0A9D4UCR1_ADICA|nr:hypothetical protein GOP47_0019391 [Adiantum capillus-veneris]